MASGAASAQFHAPKPLDEVDDQPQKKRPRSRAEPVNPNEGLPTDTGPDDDDSQPPPPSKAAPTAPREREVRPGRRSRGAETSAPDAGPADAGSPDAGAPDGGSQAALAPPLIPPSATEDSLSTAWVARRKALTSRNGKAARDAEASLKAIREELGVRDLFSIAEALDHEAQLALKAKDSGEARRLAGLATELAPDAAATWMSLAHIRFRASPTDVSGVMGALRQAAVAELQAPGPRRALIGDLATSLLMALAFTGLLALLAMVARYLRYAIHDFHHLFPRGALPVQTALLFIVLLALPWALRAGPFSELVLLAALVFAYLSPAERAVITLILVILGFLPLAAGWVARESVFAGTEAEEVWQASLGGPDAERALAHFQALDQGGRPDLPMLFELALEAKRTGRYDDALAYLRRALILKPGSPDVLNNLGNVELLKGDLDGARDAYLKATEAAPDNAVMQFNLGQISTRRAQLGSRDAAEDIERSKTAIAAVYRLDRSVADHAKDYRANHFVLDVPLSETPGLPEAVRAQADIEGQVRTWLMGAMAPELGMVIPLLVVLFLWGLAFGFRAVQICSECTRCGRAVCMRCDPDVRGGQLCGQCVFVFARKGAVDAPTRLRKESSAKAYQERWGAIRRTASLIVAGSGHLLSGHPITGGAFLLGTLFFVALAMFGQGIFRTPHASAWGLEGQIIASIIALGLWALSIRSHRAGEGK